MLTENRTQVCNNNNIYFSKKKVFKMVQDGWDCTIKKVKKKSNANREQNPSL